MSVDWRRNGSGKGSDEWETKLNRVEVCEIMRRSVERRMIKRACQRLSEANVTALAKEPKLDIARIERMKEPEIEL